MTRERVWVVTELYYPEETSTGYFLTGIAEGLASEFDTGAICCQPTYASRGVSAPWRETKDGVDIHRCRSTRLDPHFLPSRIINMLTMSVSMFFCLLTRVRRDDVVIVVTNPPPLPFLARLVVHLRRAKSVLLVHDVYPEVLAAVGMLKRTSVLYRLLDRVSRQVAAGFDRVVVLGRDMHRLFATKLGSDTRLRVIPNWGDVDAIRPLVGENPMRARLGLSGRFVVQFGGNVGRTHGIDAIVEAADALRDDDEVHFLIVGWGSRLRQLESEVDRMNLSNVTVHPPVGRNELAVSLDAGDVAIVSLTNGMAGVSVPSRLYNILAAGVPVIVMAESDSEPAMVVAESSAGWIVAPGDVEDLVSTIREAKNRRDELVTMSRRAREAAEERFSKSMAVSAWLDLIGELAES